MNVRTLLVDDEPVALRGLGQRLHDEADIEVIASCADGAAAIAAIGQLKPDLVFLDIHMPEISGFDVIEAIGLEHMPAVIFLTAFDQFAVRAFDVHAVDYLLKPIDSQRFKVALDRARQHLQQPRERLQERIAAALEDLGLHAPRRWARRLAIKLSGRVIVIDVNDIDRIEAAGNYAEIHVGAQVHLLREPLTSLIGRLDPTSFARVSRSSVVNIGRIREVQPMFNGNFVVILHDRTEVAGTQRYRAQLDRLLA